MTPERWRQVEELYHAALRRAPDERATLLAQTDPDLRRAVEARLAAGPSLGLPGEAPISSYDHTSSVPGTSDERGPAAVHHPGALHPGDQIGSYRIEGLIGFGGMGEVYRARDRKLERDVAIKALPSTVGDDSALLTRLQHEARMLAALNHPNIAVIHDLEEWAGGSFLVLELVEGDTLDVRLQRTGPLPVIEALTIGVQVAAALQAAHARGITHRDIKPANIKLTPNNTIKVLDFGLAKPNAAPAGQDAELVTRSVTGVGVLLGTPPYMSPEQVHGRPADHRSDLWALGCVLYELLTGTRAFRGETVTGTIAAILERDPDWTILPRSTPPAVRHLLARLLQKDPARRYQSAEELRNDLDACRSRLTSPGVRGLLRKPTVAVPAVVVLLAIVAGSSWFVYQSRQRTWARNVAVPEIVRLLDEANSDAAFRLGRRAERYIPNDPELLEAKRHYATRTSIESTPPGAEVYIKGYLNTGDDWLHVGRTPIAAATVPLGYLRWRLTMDGFAPAERAAYSMGSVVQFTLHPIEKTPAGMVHVPGGPFGFLGFPQVKLEDFWLDSYEVTNRQFKEFVDKGGYANRAYWTEPFVKDGGVMSWESGVAAFRDSTGRPGPSTWALGTYPDGQAEFPVGGVSWYEAAAYATFARVQLPAVHHWLRAHATPQASEILQVSNFGGQGPARVGANAGLSPFGSYDMAGNVREWCWNASSATGGAPRYILGGSWREPAYRFPGPDLADPWDRSPQNGFRTARLADFPDGAVAAPLERNLHDFSRVQPVSDEVFEAYRRFYSYERAELDPIVEEVDDTPIHWRLERITFNAAYGNERVIAYFLLPKNAEPPYQTIVYFASGIARQSRSRDEMGSELRFVDFLPRIGRAVLFLVYYGTFERNVGRPVTIPNLTRDLVISWSRDFSRSLDYLETRVDVDRENLGYFSFSNPLMPVFSAVDGRIKAGAHIGTGLIATELPDEIHPINFAPRAKEPTLLIGGRYDFIGPVETSQLPLLRLLGAPEEHKRLALFDTGHVVYPGPEMIKEVLDWFDRYLGPVRLKTNVSGHD